MSTATVYLTPKITGRAYTTHTNTEGRYSFTGLPAGDYTLRAEASGSGEVNAGSITLADGEGRNLDLTVDYTFYDEPNFIVAGVRDPISRGGHGSDTVLRSSEALAKDTASLSATPGSVSASGAGAALHHSLGVAAEKSGDALTAVHEYQTAAQLEPSEPNLFDWATELLIHRAAEPATEVFAKGHRLFLQSLRLLLGLATAWYARGDYARAAQFFFEACDRDPEDVVPYMFLGKIQSAELTQLPGYVERLARFSSRHPDNAWANYYYAASLWKQRKGPEDSETAARAREFLESAVQIDPGMGVAYLQLGIVYAELSNEPSAIAAYQKAIAADPRLPEAHYRLGQAYQRTGEKAKALRELAVYERMSSEEQKETERGRSEIPQFVIQLRNVAPSASAQPAPTSKPAASPVPHLHEP